jgi:DnaJ-class molecular chaperone
MTQTKKAKYDQYGHQAFDGSGGFGGGGGHAGMNMDDIFSQFVIFSAVPLVVVADLRRAEVNAELKEATYELK